MFLIIRYRFVVILIMCLGLFLLGSIGNTVKKQIDSESVIPGIEDSDAFERSQQNIQKTGSLTEDSAFTNGKAWRLSEDLPIIY